MELCLCLFKYFPYGGLQRDFLKIALGALARGMRVTCYVMSWEGEIPPGLQVILLPAKGRSNHARCWHFAQLLQEVLATKKYDCVMGFNRLPSLDYYFAADICFDEVVSQKYPWFYRLLPRYRTFLRLEAMVFNKKSSTQILLLNPAQKKVYQKFYQTPSERFHCIPPGIALPQRRLTQMQAREVLNLNIPKNAYWLLMVAKNLQLKGIERNLKALAELPENLRRQTYLLVIGSDGVSYYKKIVKKMRISEQVIFLGAVDDVDTAMQAADLFVHPALSEAAGMVLIEALVNSLPVLTTDNCGYAFHIEQSKGGRVVPGAPFDAASWLKALIQLLQEIPNVVLKKNAQAYVQSANLSGMVEEVLNYLKECRSFFKTPSSVE